MRAFNRVLCALLAGLFLAAGVIAVIEIISAHTNNGSVVVDWPRFARALERNTWSDAGPKVAAVILIVVGVILVLLGLRRGQPAALELAGDGSGIEAATTRKSLQRLLRTVASESEGITGAKVRVKRRKVRVLASSSLEQGSDDLPRIENDLRDRLEKTVEAMNLAQPMMVRVGVQASAPRATSSNKQPLEAPVGAGAGASAPSGGSSGGPSQGADQ
jgi:hypothetical protein